MTDVLFIITTLFVAYVVYVIVNEKRNEGTGKNSSAAASPAPQAVTSSNDKTASVSVAKAKPAPAKAEVAKIPATPKAANPKPVAAKSAAAKPAAAPAKTAAPKASKPAALKAEASTSTEVLTPNGNGLKDPKTGEVASTYTNYRFTKRWIKEALVAEGLIDKVYKNDELNASIETKLKTAIAKLEGIKKYQP